MKDFFKDVYQTLFRFARFPCEPETVAIGHPDKSSPVLVTCNFDYTVRHLKKYLEKERIDCFLLVVNTEGTNVWCAAAEGIFTAEKILAHIKVYRVGERVDRTRLILPQLSVAGVKRKELENHGWEGVYGPVYFTDLKEFLDNGMRKTRDMQALEYGYWERFKMGISHAVFCSLICAIPILVFASERWVEAVLLVWFFALCMQLIEHFIPFTRLLYKGLALALPILALIFIFVRDPVAGLQAAVGVVALSAYIGYDAQGHSHLGQNQRSGKLFGGIAVFLVLVYGGTFLL